MNLTLCRQFIYLFILVLICSCSNELVLPSQSDVDDSFSLFYKEDEICSLAIDARTSFYGIDSRSSISVANTIPVKSRFCSRSQDEKELLYVVNFENNQGFAIVSKDKFHNNVYAISDYGNLNPDDNDNEALQDYLNRASIYANSIIDTLIPVKPPHIQYVEIIRDTIYHSVIKPIVNVQWGQRYPFNNRIVLPQFSDGEKPPVGCVALAVGQAMTYFEHPDTLVRRTDDCKGQTLNLDWANIKRHIRCTKPEWGGTLICSGNINIHDKISELLFEIGYRLHTYYALPSSTAHIGNVVPVLRELGYNVSEEKAYESGRTDLTEGSILIMGSFNSPTSYTGHSYIIDGKNFYKIYVTENIYDDGIGYHLNSTRTDTLQANYVHINWGANSLGNGYYYDKIFDTREIYQSDPNVNEIHNDEHFSYSTKISFVKVTR